MRACAGFLRAETGVAGTRDAARYSAVHPATWLLADALGIQADLLRLSELARTADKSVESRLAYAEKLQQFVQRLLLVSFQISGTIAELDCEASRAQHLATSLEEARDRRIRTLTLIAIIGDALVGILAGGLSLAGEETAAAAAAISGGTIATTFGLAAIYGKTYHDFANPRNLLTAIWQPSSVAAAYPSAFGATSTRGWIHSNRHQERHW